MGRERTEPPGAGLELAAIGAGGETGLVNVDELLEQVFVSGVSDGQIDRVHRQALSLTTTTDDPMPVDQVHRLAATMVEAAAELTAMVGGVRP